MANIFLTGSTGFLGGHLARAFCERGDTVVGLVHDGHAGLDREFAHWVFGDVLDAKLIERTLADYEIDCAIHLAAQAQTTVAEADPTNTFRVNVEGTWNVLEAARRQKTKRIVCASTDKSYGEQRQRCSENFPLEGRGPYEASKAMADVLAQSYAKTYGMSIGITRCANLYGPGHMNWSTLIPGTIRRILRGERPRVYNGGESIREFLFIEDAVRAYLALADGDYVGAMNFGGGEVFQIKDIVKRISDNLGSSLEPEDVKARASDIQNQRLDCFLAKRVLGWTPEVSFDEGLEKTIAWYRAFLEPKCKAPLST